MQENGILESRTLPDDSFLHLWDSIILNQETKNRLLSQAVLNFTLRPLMDRADLPLHGIILLIGEPGTGKTSLARGLAACTAKVVTDRGEFRYIEVEPHSLTSSSLGKSQRAVTELLGGRIAEYAAEQPVIVLLDEVETLAVDRSKLSLEANPIDVHRATDAVLAQLDQLAANYPNLLFLATSNFPQAIDGAFMSRADLVLSVELPDREACGVILSRTLEALGQHFPHIKKLLDNPKYEDVVTLCIGLDGRRIRKTVAAACTYSKSVALNPDELTIEHLMRAVQDAQRNYVATQGVSQ